MYISLYRRYRPQRFADVVGQTAAVGVVARAIESGAIGHAYLFSGPRGCGKTTVARLVAKAVNCPNRSGAEPCNECDTCRSVVDGSCLDVIEIDGASNNSVDEIRDLKEHVALATFSCPYKVYIIDEVHMLSAGAFNALLKTLEEPPDRVIFILATTAPQKVPVTIRSRCQHIPFHGMTPEQIVSRLKQVALGEKLRVEDEALWEIARAAEGGMRDALSLMEQAIAYGTGSVTRETVEKLLGGGTSGAARAWLSSCREKPEAALPALEELFRSGATPERFLSVLFVLVRNLWLRARWGGRALSSLSLSDEEARWLDAQKDFLDAPRLERLMARIASLLPQARRGLSSDVACGLLVSWLLGDPASAETDAAAQADRPPVRREQAAGRAIARDEKLSPPAARPEPARLPDEARLTSDAQTRGGETPNPVSEPVAAFPSLAGLSPENDALKAALLSKIAESPLAAVQLLLSDVTFDREAGRAALLFDAEDGIAYESLSDGRAARAVKTLLADCGLEADSLDVFCGDRRERFDSLRDESLDSAAAPAPAPAREPGVAEPPRPDAPAFAPSAPSRGQDAPEPRSAPAADAARLGEYLRGFSDGELLYCRPNGEAEASPDEEED